MIFSVRSGIVLFVVLSISLAVTSFPFKNGNAQYWQRMCDNMEEVTDNSTCKDGVWRNPCGKVACLNGVAGDCDEAGSSFRFGKCAHTLFCRCGKCQGCLKGACYSELCNHRTPYAKRMNSFPVEYVNYYNEY
ncbi:neuroparsin-A-like [Bradysia coprophila]|uniref:neuroparsin-A-like n=1 Tax=Bradysia coprophila TaxID=38358 RepID=UPI00187DB2EE|nr:neuroparsin-A-like [Bradysia coprophila]